MTGGLVDASGNRQPWLPAGPIFDVRPPMTPHELEAYHLIVDYSNTLDEFLDEIGEPPIAPVAPAADVANAGWVNRIPSWTVYQGCN